MQIFRSDNLIEISIWFSHVDNPSECTTGNEAALSDEYIDIILEIICMTIYVLLKSAKSLQKYKFLIVKQAYKNNENLPEYSFFFLRVLKQKNSTIV